MSVFVLTPLLVILIFAIGEKKDIVSAGGSKISVEKDKLRDTQFIFFLLGACIFAYVTGQRFYFGDTIAYMGYFDDIDANTSEYISNFTFGNESLFKIIEAFIKQYITSDPRVYIEIISFFTIIPQLYFLYNYSGDLKLALFLFVVTGCWEHTMNGLRQYIAFSIMLMAISLLHKKKWYFYFPIVILAAQIHTSAYVFFIVFFVANFKAWGKFTKVILILGVILLLSYPISGSLINRLFEESTSYGEKYSSFNYSINIFRIIVMWIPVGISYVNRNNMIEKYKYYDLVFNMSFLCGICTTIGLLSAVYARINLYFEFFNVVLLVWNFDELENKEKFKWIKPTILTIYFCYFLYQMLITYNLHWYERYLFFCNDWGDASWI